MLDAAIGLVGKGLDAYSADKNNETQLQIARENMALQREFAQSGVQWKVADAQKAGIHPLAALGANTTSFSPVSLGDLKGSNFGEMGQDIGRAVKAAMSDQDRAEETRREAEKLTLEKAGLENEILRTELASKQKRMETNPGAVAMPGNTSVLSRVPMPRPFPGERTISSGTAVKDDDIKQKEEDFPATKIVRPFGYPLYSNPWFNDGQQFEDRYGDSEIGSTIKFGVNTVADHLYSAPSVARSLWRRYRRYQSGYSGY